MDLIDLLGVRPGRVVLLRSADVRQKHRARDLLEAVSVNVAAAGVRVAHLGLPPIVELCARRRSLLLGISADALARQHPWTLAQHTEIGWQPPTRHPRNGPPIVPPKPFVLDLATPEFESWLRRLRPELVCLEASPRTPVDLLRAFGAPVLAVGLAPELADEVAGVGPLAVNFADGRTLGLDLDTSRAPAAAHFRLGPLLTRNGPSQGSVGAGRG
jgi:hypothetical protein